MNLQEIKEAAEAATPGPWEAAGPSFGGPLPRYLNCVGVVTEDDEFEDVCSAPNPQDGTSTADMTHIATANPSAVLEMVARIEQLEAALTQESKARENVSAMRRELERENAELRKQLQAEHERQHRVWTEIQSQHRDHSPLSMKEQT